MKKQKISTLKVFLMLPLYGFMTSAQNIAVVKNSSKIPATKEYKTPMGTFTFHAQNTTKEEMLYTLQTVKTHGKGTSTLLRNNNLGVPQEEKNNANWQNIVSIFPNPFNITATIIVNPQGQVFTDRINLIVYDIFGREVQKTEITNLKGTINRGGLSSGMYFYKVTYESEIIGRGKFIIQ